MQHTSGPTVCGTNTRIYVSIFFLYRFYKNVHAAHGTVSKVMLAPHLLLQTGRVCVDQTEDKHWCVGVPTDQSDWLLSHSHRDAQEKLSNSSLLFFS